MQIPDDILFITQHQQKSRCFLPPPLLQNIPTKPQVHELGKTSLRPFQINAAIDMPERASKKKRRTTIMARIMWMKLRRLRGITDVLITTP
ncbi:hypothetical protein Zmor_013052 [Zophobas morio]|uniref:Uncharacterized protein n=1 Tax=Zophobas morio TaxID=2755281 RepID=A0AA38IH94_9CUCU|nr:hypothetical protein Zmor_013052 [Zophobas morio]